jgi:hypothetical protein
MRSSAAAAGVNPGMELMTVYRERLDTGAQLMSIA